MKKSFAKNLITKKDILKNGIYCHFFFVNFYKISLLDYTVGEIEIRTTLNDFWMNNRSQVFYKVRVSERSKGYGTKMLYLALDECRKLGMRQVRINCDDNNIASKCVIEKNDGRLDIRSYTT